MTDLAQALASIDRAAETLAAATRAAVRIARQLAADTGARTADDDEWTRLPQPGHRCHVSAWSRSTILRRITEGRVRRRTVGGSTYYSAADVRRLISREPVTSLSPES